MAKVDTGGGRAGEGNQVGASKGDSQKQDRNKDAGKSTQGNTNKDNSKEQSKGNASGTKDAPKKDNTPNKNGNDRNREPTGRSDRQNRDNSTKKDREEKERESKKNAGPSSEQKKSPGIDYNTTSKRSNNSPEKPAVSKNTDHQKSSNITRNAPTRPSGASLADNQLSQSKKSDQERKQDRINTATGLSDQIEQKKGQITKGEVKQARKDLSGANSAPGFTEVRSQAYSDGSRRTAIQHKDPSKNTVIQDYRNKDGTHYGEVREQDLRTGETRSFSYGPKVSIEAPNRTAEPSSGAPVGSMSRERVEEGLPSKDAASSKSPASNVFREGTQPKSKGATPEKNLSSNDKTARDIEKSATSKPAKTNDWAKNNVEPRSERESGISQRNNDSNISRSNLDFSRMSAQERFAFDAPLETPFLDPIDFLGGVGLGAIKGLARVFSQRAISKVASTGITSGVIAGTVKKTNQPVTDALKKLGLSFSPRKGKEGVIEVFAGEDEAMAMFEELRAGSHYIATRHDPKLGTLIGHVTDKNVMFREAAKTTSGHPTLDVSGLEEGVKKLKFIGSPNQSPP